MPLESSSTPLPEEIVTKHRDELLGCVAQEFNLPIGELELAANGTLEEADGSISVAITHATGLYMVNFKDVNDSLIEVTASDLTRANLEQR